MQCLFELHSVKLKTQVKFFCEFRCLGIQEIYFLTNMLASFNNTIYLFAYLLGELFSIE